MAKKASTPKSGQGYNSGNSGPGTTISIMASQPIKVLNQGILPESFGLSGIEFTVKSGNSNSSDNSKQIPLGAIPDIKSQSPQISLFSGQLPGIVPSSNSQQYNDTGYDPVQKKNLGKQTNKPKEFTIYTALPQDEPVIISSAEYLPLKDTVEITSFGYNQAYDRDFALSTKEGAQTITASTAAKVIATKDSTLKKIVEKRLSFVDLANKQRSPITDILSKLEKAVFSLDLRNLPISMDQFNNVPIESLLSSENIDTDSISVGKFSNSTLYATILLLLKKQIILHNRQSSIIPNVSKFTAPNTNLYRQTFYDLFTLPNTESNLGLIRISNDQNSHLKSYSVLNKNLNSSTNAALLGAATIGLEGSQGSTAPFVSGLLPNAGKQFLSPFTQGKKVDQVRVAFSPYINNEQVGAVNPLKGLSIVPLLKCNTGEELDKSSYVKNTQNLLGLTLFNLIKEESYSRWLSVPTNRDTLSDRGIVIDISLGGAANFSLWDSLIGVFQKDITDFTDADQTDPGVSLLSLTKQIITIGQNSQLGFDNEYRVLSLEVNDDPDAVDFSEGVTNGGTYYLDSALTGKVSNTNTVTASPEKPKYLLDKLDKSFSSLYITKSLNAIALAPVNTLYNKFLFDSDGVIKSLTKAYEEAGFIKLQSPNKDEKNPFGKSNNKFIIDIDHDKFIKFNPDHKSTRSTRLLASLIKRTKNLAFSNDTDEKRVGESILKAIFSVCLRRMYDSNFDDLSPPEAIYTSGYSPFKTSPRIKSINGAISAATLAQGDKFLAKKFTNEPNTFRKAKFLTLIDQNGNANSPQLAIDGLIFAHPEMFPVTTDPKLGLTSTSIKVGTKEEVIIKWEFVNAPNGILPKAIPGGSVSLYNANEYAILNGGSYFNDYIDLPDNSLLISIAKCLHKIRRQKGLFRVEKDFGNGLNNDDSTTIYGGISKISYMWNYFLVLVEVISSLTPEEFIGPYERSDTQSLDLPLQNVISSPSFSLAGGYATKFSQVTMISQGSSIFKTVKNNISPTQSGNNFIFDIELNYEKALSGIQKVLSNEVYHMNSRISALEIFILNAGEKVGDFKDYLSNIGTNQNLKNFYNEIYTSAISEVKPGSTINTPLTSDEINLRNYLVSQAFSQEQLIHSSHVADEIIDRFSEDKRDLSTQSIKNLSSVRPEYSNQNLFSSKTTVYSNQTYAIDSVDFLPVNDFDAFSYGVIRNYFTKEQKLNKENGNNVRIITVGIPPRMVRKLAGTPSIQSSFAASDIILKNIIKLKVYKSDVLNPGLPYLPKEFRFDLLRYPTRVLSNWNTFKLETYATADDFIKNIPMKRFSLAAEKSFNIDQTTIGNGVTSSARDNAYISLQSFLGVNTPFSVDQFNDIYNNHAKSFLLEEYINLFTSARVDEGHFYHYVDLERSLKNLSDQFNFYISTTGNKFDATNLDTLIPTSAKPEAALNFIKRREESVKRYFMNETVFLPTDEIRKKIFLPKKFDRTFTVAIDPDDFELDADAIKSNETLKNIYNSQVQKGLFSQDSYKRKVPSSQSEIFIDEYWVEVEVEYSPFSKSLLAL